MKNTNKIKRNWKQAAMQYEAVAKGYSERIAKLEDRIKELEAINKENREQLMMFASSAKWAGERTPFWKATKFQKWVMRRIGLGRVVLMDFYK